MLISYAFSLAIKKSCGRQSNALDWPIRNAPKVFLLSIADFHFSSTDKRQCWALNPFLKPHWYFDKAWYTYDVHENCQIFKTPHSPCLSAFKIPPSTWLWTFNFRRTPNQKRKHNPTMTIICYQVLPSGRLSFSVSTH